MADLIAALQISAAGMGLVFGAILVIWLVMSLLVRLTAPQAAAPDAPDATGALADGELRRRAAAVAVAVALAGDARARGRQGRAEGGPRGATAPPAFAVPTDSQVGVWQAVMRGRGLKEAGRKR